MSTVVSHPELQRWINEIFDHCEAKDVYLCDGSQEQFEELAEKLVAAGTLVRLNEERRPNSYWAHSDPRDVARVESKTYICSERQEDAGPTNNWRSPLEMKATLTDLYKGSMRGRTMYVIPFSMGPLGSEFSIIGVELTDSAYVVLNMMYMTEVGRTVLERLGDDGNFVKCLHSVGAPIDDEESEDVPWPCNPENTYIAHFPETEEIWSFGSGYGGNALLGKKCLALRIATAVARREGWLAEHMLILKLTDPSGRVHYVAGAFPSACGKTNLAMLVPTLKGWKAETIGDDIAWMRFGSDGRLYAVNPEKGFFGVAPGTSSKSNPVAMETIKHSTIFTNTALTEDLDVWWEGIEQEPGKLTDWQGKPWDPSVGSPAAHPNARFTVPASNSPTIAPEWQDPNGVPISAIMFGGRRSSLVPLVTESFSFDHGVFMGATMASETTAAAEGKVGKLRRDPFAMLPFCGYHMADYFAHWLAMGESGDDSKLPKIFLVNWFRRDADGRFLWPGYGENSRVLKWMIERVEGKVDALSTPLGLVPKPEDLDLEGLNLEPERLTQLFDVNESELIEEVVSIEEHFNSFGPKLPKRLWDHLERLRSTIRNN